MDHRLQASSTGGQNSFHVYYPFIPPASYLPAIAAQEGTTTSKTSFPIPISTQSQKSNFSISRILQTVAPTAAVSDEDVTSPPNTISIQQQQKSLIDTAAKMLWLQQLASAHHHPLLSRQTLSDHKKVAKKRKLGRNPRIPFTQQQIELLEKRYSANRYLSSLDVVDLSKNLELSEARVKIWFQNRRARERRDEKSTKSSISLTNPGQCHSMMFNQTAVTSSSMPSLVSETAGDMSRPWSASASNSTQTMLPVEDGLFAGYSNNERSHSTSMCKLEVVSDTD